MFLAKQISVPITALLDAAREVRKGNLKHRVEVRAVDELALPGPRLQPDDRRSWNPAAASWTAAAASPRRSSKAFPPASSPSAPTAPSSASTARSPRSSRPKWSRRATRLEDLFSREDTAEIKYLMKRARRTGTATRQLEMRTDTRKLQIAVTVSALEEKLTSGFVVVLEDTSELLRAQKAAAWHEVARRVAHEIKNPLTPIALSAERIARQMDRLALPARRRPHSARMRRHHFEVRRVRQDAGGRVLAIRALSRRPARRAAT